MYFDFASPESPSNDASFVHSWIQHKTNKSYIILRLFQYRIIRSLFPFHRSFFFSNTLRTSTDFHCQCAEFRLKEQILCGRQTPEVRYDVYIAAGPIQRELDKEYMSFSIPRGLEDGWLAPFLRRLLLWSGEYLPPASGAASGCGANEHADVADCTGDMRVTGAFVGNFIVVSS